MICIPRVLCFICLFLCIVPVMIFAQSSYELDTPTLIQPTGMIYRDQLVILDWNDIESAALYEVARATNRTFTEHVSHYWPTDSEEPMPQEAGHFFYRVRAWSGIPETGGMSSGWSNTIELTVFSGRRPGRVHIVKPSRPPVMPGFTLRWVHEEAAYIYQVEQSTSRFFRKNKKEYWPMSNVERVTFDRLRSNYFRVRAWNQLPEHGGEAGAWSRWVRVRPLSDSRFLSYVEKKTFDFFMAATNEHGVTLDRMWFEDERGDVASIASSGFYLSTLTIGVRRHWISKKKAEQCALRTLRLFATEPNPDLRTETPGMRYHGYYFHFLTLEGTPSRAPWLEVSSIDTALFVAGALQAGEFFGGEVKALADYIYRTVEWNYLYDDGMQLMRMAVKFSDDRDLTTGNPDGFYGHYCESILLSLLAIGAPTHAVPAEAFYTPGRHKDGYEGPDLIHPPGGQAFIFQYPQLWFDFRDITDAYGVNWHENSVEGLRANYRYCKSDAVAQEWLFNEYLWGLTACDTSNGEYIAAGALPAMGNANNGTLAPTGVGGSVCFTPDIAIPALKYMYTELGDQIWKKYGFLDSFNLREDWVDSWYLGIDQGAIMLSIENHRSNLIWKTFMKNEHVQRALARTGFSGYVMPPLLIEDFEDRDFWTPETNLGWWDTDGRTVYRRTHEEVTVSEGSVAMRVEYDKSGLAWSAMGAHISESNPNTNFSVFDTVSCDVYGAAEVLLKVSDQDGRECDIETRSTNEDGVWTTVTYDLSNLMMSDVDTTRIEDCLFFVAPGDGNASGAFVVDAIRLSNTQPRILDDFDGNALVWWDRDGTDVYTRAITKNPSLSGMGSMTVHCDKQDNEAYAHSFFAAHIPVGDSRADFTGGRKLVFWFWGGNTYLDVALRSRAGDEVSLGNAYCNKGDSWIKVSLDYSHLDEAFLTDIDNIIFTVNPGETRNSLPVGGDGTWTFHIEDLSIE